MAQRVKECAPARIGWIFLLLAFLKAGEQAGTIFLGRKIGDGKIGGLSSSSSGPLGAKWEIRDDTLVPSDTSISFFRATIRVHTKGLLNAGTRRFVF